ncbi:magnesium/cobalt transporter CorA [Flavobacterium silvaticum]|uniref:Magnesium transport protein CorA n=1 Tax=Flavobacterium silvaticum TaxID=1852020 RepID=A0A972FNR5_9FLAO|nr:magnesium/cobalt transporter CorA [Flavobacterium silvaticum]NMH29088.1 magnesium/cobalt transporter CorA [Flavobacterium silvaticum]
MRRIKYKQVRKVQPNFFEYTGMYKDEPVAMQLFIYNEEGYEEYKDVNLQRVQKEISDPNQHHDVKWLNVHGLHQTDLIRELGTMLEIEPAITGDVVNVAKRSRMEELDEVLFFSIKSVLAEEETDVIRVEQISFLLKGNLLISFQERKSDFFSHIRERIRTGAGVVRRKKNGYLLYLMLDAVMENFFITLEQFEDDIEKLLIDSKSEQGRILLEKIEKVRECLNFLKRSVIPLRDALYNLKNMDKDSDFKGFEDTSLVFFGRLHQKALEILDQIDNDLNSVETASNLYYASQSQRMNAIMKTLTIFSVIFMPLTFIVGVYGMNFDNMPELKTQNGYYVIWGIMIICVIGMTTYFRRKKWF